jgi:hypothetical protein
MPLDEFELQVIKSSLYNTIAEIYIQCSGKILLNESCDELQESINTISEIIKKLGDINGTK